MGKCTSPHFGRTSLQSLHHCGEVPRLQADSDGVTDFDRMLYHSMRHCTAMKTGGSDAAGKENATAQIKPWQSSNSECRTLSTLVYTYGAFAPVLVKFSAYLNTIFHIFCEAWSPPVYLFELFIGELPELFLLFSFHNAKNYGLRDRQKYER